MPADTGKEKTQTVVPGGRNNGSRTIPGPFARLFVVRFIPDSAPSRLRPAERALDVYKRQVQDPPARLSDLLPDCPSVHGVMAALASHLDRVFTAFSRGGISLSLIHI